MTHDQDPFGVEKKFTDPDGNVYRRPMRRNTRGQNSAAGAGVGAALYGTVGAAAGGAVGRSRAKAGVRALHGVGAAPSRARTAGIIAGHSLRTAGRAGAALGAAGAVYGAAVGAISPHRKDRKKLPLGRVQKNDGDPFGIEKGKNSALMRTGVKMVGAGAKGAVKDKGNQADAVKLGVLSTPVLAGAAGYAGGRRRRRKVTLAKSDNPFGIAKSAARMGEQAAEWAGHLPKHTAGAVAANKSAFHASIEMPGHLRPVKPGLRIKKPQLVPHIAKSAFGIEHVEVEKKKIPAVLPGERRRATGKAIRVRATGVKPVPRSGEQGQRRAVRSGRL